MNECAAALLELWKMNGDAAMGGAWTPEFCNSWRTCGDPGPGFANSVGYVDCWEKWADAIPSGYVHISYHAQ